MSHTAKASAQELGLRKLKAAIWDNAPGSGEEPMRPKALARSLVKFRYNSHFRSVLRRMIEDGLIEKHGDGVRRRHPTFPLSPSSGEPSCTR